MNAKTTLSRWVLLILPFLFLLLLVSCESGPEAGDRSERLRAIGRTIGDVAVQLKGTEYVKREAPHLMPVLDADGNGVLSLDELRALEQADPVQWAALIALLEAK